MSDRTIGIDELISEIDEHLSETDAVYLAALAEKVVGGTFEPLSDGETIRQDGCKRSFGMVVESVLGALHGLPAARVAALADEILTDAYELDAFGRVQVTFKEDRPAPPGLG